MAGPAAARLLPLLLALGLPAVAAPRDLPDEIFVTATRYPVAALDLAGNTALVDGARIALIGPTHINELGTQLPGVWLSRGSGQESLTAIRSPVLTGPGSCGSFLILEDGVSIRPTGFCNVNELFELPSEQAAAVEVIRGPGTALYGSNAVHGTLNLLLPAPGDDGLELAGGYGPNHFARGEVRAAVPGATPDTGLVGGLLVDHDGGFREASDYRQAKGFLKYATAFATGRLELAFSGNVLDQETAGFILGEDSYQDEALRTSNPNPESYRDANAQRLTARWRPAANTADEGVDLIAFLRRSEMDFLQHFLLGQPTEENGQASGGATLLRYTTRGALRLTTGFDVEVAKGWLEETQSQPDVGTPVRPQGQHYDYDAWQWLAAPYLQAAWQVAPRVTLTGGVRLEWLRYDYDNHLAADTFGLFTRPADRSDSFTNLAPNLGITVRVGGHTAVYATLVRGFRAPQAAELYRLQAGQDVADLDSESIDSLEAGWRWQSPRARVELAAFAMRKRDYVLQDSNRYNVSNGESEHVGTEVDIELRSDAGFYGALAGTWARQTYAFSQAITGGETIVDGNDIDTAPRTLGSLRAGWAGESLLAEAEWVHQGGYYLTAQEDQDYPGHDLLNLRLAWDFTPAWGATLRLNNATDERYADRADFAFGDYRYFPGRERELYVELRWQSP